MAMHRGNSVCKVVETWCLTSAAKYSIFGEPETEYIAAVDQCQSSSITKALLVTSPAWNESFGSAKFVYLPLAYTCVTPTYSDHQAMNCKNASTAQKCSIRSILCSGKRFYSSSAERPQYCGGYACVCRHKQKLDAAHFIRLWVQCM